MDERAPTAPSRTADRTAAHPGARTPGTATPGTATRVPASPPDPGGRARAAAADHRFGSGEVVLETERLLLRRWRASDLEPFAAMNADPEVVRHLPAALDRAASDALARYADACFDVLGHGLAAVEERASGSFLGFVGLARHRRRPDVDEIGWRLHRGAWGRGCATEAARAWVDAAAGPLHLPRLISITTASNTRSLAVMRRLGMVEVERERWEEVRDVVVVHALDLRARTTTAGAASTADPGGAVPADAGATAHAPAAHAPAAHAGTTHARTTGAGTAAHAGGTP